MKNGIDIKGTVNLIICDYDTLVVKTTEKRPAIKTEGATLIIYGQPAGKGTLIADGGKVGVGEIDGPAGIGGGPNASGGTVIINGDSVAVTSDSGGAAIGGGFCGNGGTVIINNGKVFAKSEFYGAGIGGGRYGSGGTVIINGGLVTAEGHRFAAGIGGGSSSTEESSGHKYPVYGGTVTINGGTVTATGAGLYGVGIGAGGRNGIGANLTINGGNVTVEGDLQQGQSVCIGGYRSDDSAMTTITNGAIKFAGTSLNENNTIATRANISGGIFSYEPQSGWLQSGCYADSNSDETTRNEYPWKVVHTGAWETVTYGDNIAVSPTFTSGTELPAGTQITFTAADRTASGYVFAGFYEKSTFDTPITTGVRGQTYTVTVTDGPISVYTKYEPYHGSTTYIDKNGISHNIDAYAVTDVTDKRVTWGEAGKETWYVVIGSDVTLSQGANCVGKVNLILADGAKLTARVRDDDKACIKVSGEGNSLAIYGQANQSGELVAEGFAGAGIGGASGDDSSDITINGGIVTTVSVFGAGIGGGCNGNGSNITINGGTVTASVYLGNGIGGGVNGEGEDIFVAPNLIVKAGNTNPPTTLIENNGGDLAESLAGKQYVTIEPKPSVNVSYIDEYGVEKTANAMKVIGSSSSVTLGTAGKETWYVVMGSDVTLAQGADCQGDVNLILADGAKLSVTGITSQAGICVSGTGNSLTIYGQTYQSGKLDIEVHYGAGIGGKEKGEGSNITINGGIIKAKSDRGAGIGGGSFGNGSNITINGGTVTAIGFENGIGGGWNAQGESKDIFVATNLIVKAGASEQSATVIENNGGDLAGSLAGKQYVTIEPAPTANVSYIDAEGISHDIINAYVVYSADTPVTWGTAGKETWYVVAGTDVRLSNGAVCQGDVNLILADGAKLTATGDATQAGICVSGTGNSLTIYGQTAQSGQLEANGGNCAAGIGGGIVGKGNNIIINGGTVTANGGYGGAGIGGGYQGAGSDITINGGTVTANGGAQAAGIGGGCSNLGSSITINGGTVTANGGSSADNHLSGAGIGGGYKSSGSFITINGGTVTATGGSGAVGIGSGEDGSYASNIKVATTLIVKAGSTENPTEVIENNGGDLTISLEGKQYVTITEPFFNITANQDPGHKQNYYSTFYSSTCDYRVPESVTAYTGAVDGSVLRLTPVADGIIPAGEAVILRLTSADNTETKKQFDLAATTTMATKSGTNALTGTDVAKTLGANGYALSYGQNGVGFYLWEGKEIGANKAYLTLDDNEGENAKAFTFQFDDGEATAIEQPTISGKQSSDTYNLNVVRVDENYKGIVIKNGKKVLQK